MFVWALQLLVREDQKKNTWRSASLLGLDLQQSWFLGIYQNCRASVTPGMWVYAGPSAFVQASSLLWEPLFDCGSEASR